jgi:hypothetical protein
MGPGSLGCLVTLSTNLQSLGIPSWSSVRSLDGIGASRATDDQDEVC